MLALAAPAQLPAFAQGADAQGVDDVQGADAPRVGAQKGDDAQSDAPQADATAGNKAEAADPPAGGVQPGEGPAIPAAKVDDKGEADAPVDAGAPDTGPPGAAAADAGAPDTGAPAVSAAADAAAAVVTAPVLDDSPSDQPSGLAEQFAGWVGRTGDNGDKPFAIVDKVGARIFVFDFDGRLRGSAPVLVGLARGDYFAAGIGDRALSAIGPEERTTPAGRFVARFGLASGGKTVLWVDYADAISLHPVVTSNPTEHRLRRIKSAAPDDHRISYGCINVPARFYERVVLKAFRSAGGIVYVLPDTRPLDEVFPVFAASVTTSAAVDQADPAAADQAAQPAQGADTAPADADRAVGTQPAEPPTADTP